MKTIALVISMAFTISVSSQVSIIPQPESINLGNGTFMLPINAGIISTNGISVAGLKKCIPITRDLFSHAEAIDTIESDEVLDARMQLLSTTPSIILKSFFFFVKTFTGY